MIYILIRHKFSIINPILGHTLKAWRVAREKRFLIILIRIHHEPVTEIPTTSKSSRVEAEDKAVSCRTSYQRPQSLQWRINVFLATYHPVSNFKIIDDNLSLKFIHFPNLDFLYVYYFTQGFQLPSTPTNFIFPPTLVTLGHFHPHDDGDALCRLSCSSQTLLRFYSAS